MQYWCVAGLALHFVSTIPVFLLDARSKTARNMRARSSYPDVACPVSVQTNRHVQTTRAVSIRVRLTQVVFISGAKCRLGSRPHAQCRDVSLDSVFLYLQVDK